MQQKATKSVSCFFPEFRQGCKKTDVNFWLTLRLTTNSNICYKSILIYWCMENLVRTLMTKSLLTEYSRPSYPWPRHFWPRVTLDQLKSRTESYIFCHSFKPAILYLGCAYPWGYVRRCRGYAKCQISSINIGLGVQYTIVKRLRTANLNWC
jgi:hypothetical protein